MDAAGAGEIRPDRIPEQRARESGCVRIHVL